ncbi:DUF2207 domain-containing protein [Rhizobium sp. BK251]|uniref:DUF2207 domain-containing protein n=1 Tax=Rhizobium sp. BK251 TaxID=2512125 RepID=UPI0010449FCF|nr:DUF2207 domain-containing protein [Rhizobium sp. BK251]TCL75864.1 putative membrane protein DUF2207 [Rhizobium sp. BK251]
MKGFLATLALAVLWLATPLSLSSVSAAEVINSFRSAVEVERDGQMQVSETLDVQVEGREIKRGIFRDFPLTFLDANGRRADVDFEVVSVERDGRPEPWHSESIGGGIRIYTGEQDVFLDPGRHSFTITYRTNRQIRYFADHDELYWNVTGNGWRFPILSASADVTLPEGAIAEDVNFFTGPQGSTAHNARVTEQGNRVDFEMTRPLAVGEGLTIAVKLAKGVIAPPSASQERMWFLKDNLDLILGFGGLAVVLIYYTRAWLAVGRDPARGVMVPRWDPPDGLSPALVNYVDNKGFSGQGWTALSATALDLAVKGYVVLEDLDSRIIIRRTGKALPPNLESGQQALLDNLGGEGSQLVIDKANGVKVQKIGQKFRSAIEREHRGQYYKANVLYIVGGVLLSALFLAGIVLFGKLHEEAIPLIVVPLFLSVFASILAVSIGKAFHRHSSLLVRIIRVVVFAIIGVVAVSVLSGFVAMLATSAAENEQLPLLVAITGIFIANFVFFFLMGAPTPLGARLMDGIDGLRQYLTLAEKDRMNMQGAPTMSPQHFETLLPYAVALGVEKPWSRAFEAWLAAAAAGAAAAAYSPGWYSGHSYGSFSDRIGGFSSSMSSTIASTIPAPRSSSSSGFSSGGGFSGGGGGGGGGGGW